MTGWDALIADAMRDIAARGQLRTLRPAALAPGGRLVRDGNAYLDFSSNDYLGLARHPALIERARRFTEDFGAGAGASRLVTGTSEAHLAIEAKIAAFKGTEAALVFASGWQANAAVLPALLGVAPGVAVFTDRLIHASMHAGIAAAGVRQHRFAHNDLDHLARLLETRGGRASARIIVTESVFSMDGDRVNLARIGEIASAHDALVYLDEAHATGVLGPRGAGLSAQFPGTADIAMGTFSKGMGGFGAYIACSRTMRDFLVNRCGGFIYSTAPPPAVLGAIDAALDLVPDMAAERRHLDMLAGRLRDGLRSLSLDTGESDTQIVPAVVGEERAALALSETLERRGIIAAAIRPPTVPPGSSRLRLALRATHCEADIDGLLNAIEDTRCG